MNKDIGYILKGWDYKPGQITVRRIKGDDGMDKIQMRLDLGVLQMEMVGRPDGKRPRGYESLLRYHQHRLETHVQRNGTELGFQLTRKQALLLREEGVMYYHRYLAMFVLEEFEQVVRDTQRNLDLADFLLRYSEDEKDGMALEQYRPYILMMNARAKANLDLKSKAPRTALAHLEAGLSKLETFFEGYDQAELFEKCSETRILRSMIQEIKNELSSDPVEKMRAKLQELLEAEKYEQAALLRDQIRQLEVENRKPDS